jgi:hypothetical protein
MAFVVPAAGAKDEYWAQICGSRGCKLVKDRLVAAALTSEAQERGSRARSSAEGPAYTVRYALPNSGKTVAPAYWLATDEIEFLISHSQASVSELFIRAKAGVQPFPSAKAHRSGSLERSVAAGAAVFVFILVTLVLLLLGGIPRRSVASIRALWCQEDTTTLGMAVRSARAGRTASVLGGTKGVRDAFRRHSL